MIVINLREDSFAALIVIIPHLEHNLVFSLLTSAALRLNYVYLLLLIFLLAQSLTQSPILLTPDIT